MSSPYFRTPTGGMPTLQMMLDDIPTRDLAKVGRHLDVSARTLGRWLQTGNAPRMAMIALFWETQWGLGIVHTEAVNRERVALAWARSLERETHMLRARIARLEETGDFGAANGPIYAVR